jgi:hypothetical protein
MNKFVLLTTAAVFALTGVASAATLTNNDKSAVKVSVTVDGGKAQHISLKPGANFDSKGKAASFKLHKQTAVSAKADGNFVISGGKIVDASAKAAATPAKTTAKVADKTVTPATLKQ